MLILLGELARRQGKLEEARAHGVQALRHAELGGDRPLPRARAHAFLGSIDQALGQKRRAAHHRRSAAEAMRLVGDRRATAELLLQLAGPQTVGAKDARTWLAEAGALADQIGWQEGVTRARAALARLGVT